MSEGGDGAGLARGGGRRWKRHAFGPAWGRRLPVALLLLSLGIAGLGAVDAYRSQHSHAATTASLLRDYGGFAAFTYQQRSGQLLAEALDRRLRIARSNQMFLLGLATEQCLLLVLGEPATEPQCRCAPSIAGDYAFFARVGQDAASARWAGRAPKPAAAASIVEAVQRHARSSYGRGWPHAIADLGAKDGGLVAYTLVQMPVVDTSVTAGRDSLIYGFEVDPKLLAGLFARALGDEVLLPPSLTRDRPNGEVISVEVVGPKGDVLFDSDPEAKLAFSSETAQGEMFGGGTIRASILPSVADDLIIGGLPRERTPLLVLLFAVAGALAVLAILQLRREDRLALLRQDFVASVSHELRTPLAQVRLFTETLRLGRTRTEQQREWALENIDRETHRLSNLVDKILHFSRSGHGAHGMRREPGDLADTVREAMSSFERLIPPGKASLEPLLPSRLPTELHADSIRQVVLNLLDNAIRYGPPGQVVRVRGERSSSSVRISVDDEGPGVARADRERIFEPFLRGEQTIGSVVVGSGIGLAVVREIVAAHGGEAWVEDAPSGGARFVVELPALHTARAEDLDGRVASIRSSSGVA
jgi:signal transduction histidine kinase